MHYSKETVKAYENFAQEIGRLYKKKGIEYIQENCPGAAKEDIELIIDPKNIAKVLVGDPLQYKELISPYKKLFNKKWNDNKDIMHNLLFAFMPQSMREMRKEINDYLLQINPSTGRRNTWEDFETFVNEGGSGKKLNRQGLYFHLHGYHYPERETIVKLRKVLSTKCINNLLRELYSVKVETLQVYDINLNDIISVAKQWNDDELEMLVLFLLNDFTNKKRAVKTIQKALTLVGA